MNVVMDEKDRFTKIVLKNGPHNLGFRVRSCAVCCRSVQVFGVCVCLWFGIHWFVQKETKIKSHVVRTASIAHWRYWTPASQPTNQQPFTSCDKTIFGFDWCEEIETRLGALHRLHSAQKTISSFSANEIPAASRIIIIMYAPCIDRAVLRYSCSQLRRD